METAIYLLRDPKTSKVRYVGKSLQPQKRYYRHIYEARKGGKKRHCYCWIRSLLDINLFPILEIIEYTESWRERESYWIKYYEGELTNLCEGGVGNVGYKHTDEWKKNASLRMIGNKIMNGKKLPKETLLKMSVNSGSKKNAYKVCQYDKDLVFVKKWNTVCDAAKFYNIGTNVIYNNITGLSKRTKFGIWKKESILI